MDIDIDTPTSFDPKEVFPNVILASRVMDTQLLKHPCGVYFQTMPSDPVTTLAAIPHDHATEFGFTKIDFLHLSFLDMFDNKKQMKALLKRSPKWGLLLRSDVVSKLFQLHNNIDLVRAVQPSSIQEIADCISLIRPGKLSLVDAYHKDKESTREKLYTIDPNDKYSYKKGHALSYALIVVLQMHLIEYGIM